jgi:tetratricopeptide (TPR) repeat protein
MSFLVVPRGSAAVRPSAPQPPRGSRPSTNNLRAVDPDDLMAISQSKEALAQWAESSVNSSPQPVASTPLNSQRPELVRARAFVDVAEGFLRQGRLQEAKDVAEEAATLLRVRGDPLDEARVLVVLGQIEAQNGDLSRAAVKVQKAIATYGARAPGHVPPVWYCLAASIARERNEHTAAARFEELALASIRASRQGDERPEALLELADALERIGDARLLAGKAADAMTAFSECLLVRRRLVAALGEGTEPLGEVSYTLKRLADAAAAASDLITASGACREAMGIDRKLYERDRDNAEMRYQLADSLWRFGDLLTTNGDAAEAASVSEEATLLLAGADSSAAAPPRREPSSRLGAGQTRKRGGGLS